MKFRLDINTPLGIFYRYIDNQTINSTEEVLKELKILHNMNYVSWSADKDNETALIFYEDVWKNSVVEIRKTGE